jgi:hypothetical protein
MAEVTSTTIVPIAFYCFFLGVYFLSLAVNAILNNNVILSSNNFLAWLPVLALTIFAGGLVIVGLGILQRHNLSWKVLFFCLAIKISCIASLIIAFLIFLALGVNFLNSVVQFHSINPVTWFSFLGVFLSEIIVLYYLSQDEVVSNFGGMGDLISPF